MLGVPLPLAGARAGSTAVLEMCDYQHRLMCAEATPFVWWLAAQGIWADETVAEIAVEQEGSEHSTKEQ